MYPPCRQPHSTGKWGETNDGQKAETASGNEQMETSGIDRTSQIGIDAEAFKLFQTKAFQAAAPHPQNLFGFVPPRLDRKSPSSTGHSGADIHLASGVAPGQWLEPLNFKRLGVVQARPFSSRSSKPPPHDGSDQCMRIEDKSKWQTSGPEQATTNESSNDSGSQSRRTDSHSVRQVLSSSIEGGDSRDRYPTVLISGSISACSIPPNPAGGTTNHRCEYQHNMVNQNTHLNSNVTFQQYLDTHFACHFFNSLINNSVFFNPLTGFAQQVYNVSPGLVGYSGDKVLVHPGETETVAPTYRHHEKRSVHAATDDDGNGMQTAEEGTQGDLLERLVMPLVLLPARR